MAITLTLKLRRTKALDRDAWRSAIRAVLSNTNSEEQKVDDLFGMLLRFPLETINDSHWLETIVNFVPKDDKGQPKPVPLTKQAEWLKLARRVNALDDTREGTFTLSTADVERIWRRLTSDEFELVAFPAAFSEFVLDFCEGAGKRFAGDVDEDE